MRVIDAITLVLFAYDSWCYARVEALLKWLDEWLSISQKRAEVGMILVYSALMVAGPIPLHSLAAFGINVGAQLCIGWTMYFLHRKPEALRQYARLSTTSKWGRLFIQALVTGLVIFYVTADVRHTYDDISRAVGQVIYVVFFYAVDITSIGEPGRRRKLALAELKKMFGTEWIPKVLPVPQ